MKSNQVAFIGLNNVFGRIVSSLLKQSPNINKLVLYDDKNGASVKSYINGTEENCNVTTVYGREKLPEALSNADVVIIGDELFQKPKPEDIPVIGQKAAEYAKLIAESSPNAFLVIAASPLNYVLPIFARVLESAGCFNPRKVLGATSCDTLRASTLLSARLRLCPSQTILPVVGGGSATTRIPLFSQANYSPIKIDQETQLDIIEKLRQFEGSEYSERNIMERAYASVRFANSVLAARSGTSPIPEIALTRNNEIPEVEYFSMPLLIGKEGVEKIMKLPKLSSLEKEILNSAVSNLRVDIELSKNILETKEDEKERGKLQSLHNSYEGIDFLTSNTEAEDSKKIENVHTENVKTTFVKPNFKLNSNNFKPIKPKRRRRNQKLRKKKHKRIKKSRKTKIEQDNLPNMDARESLMVAVKPVQNEKLEEMSKSFEIKLNEVFSPPKEIVKLKEENAKIPEPSVNELNVTEILDSTDSFLKKEPLKTKPKISKAKIKEKIEKAKIKKEMSSKLKNLSMSTPRKFQMKNIVLKSKGPIKINMKNKKHKIELKEKPKNDASSQNLPQLNTKNVVDNRKKKLEAEGNIQDKPFKILETNKSIEKEMIKKLDEKTKFEGNVEIKLKDEENKKTPDLKLDKSKDDNIKELEIKKSHIGKKGESLTNKLDSNKTDNILEKLEVNKTEKIQKSVDEKSVRNVEILKNEAKQLEIEKSTDNIEQKEENKTEKSVSKDIQVLKDLEINKSSDSEILSTKESDERQKLQNKPSDNQISSTKGSVEIPKLQNKSSDNEILSTKESDERQKLQNKPSENQILSTKGSVEIPKLQNKSSDNEILPTKESDERQKLQNKPSDNQILSTKGSVDIPKLQNKSSDSEILPTKESDERQKLQNKPSVNQILSTKESVEIPKLQNKSSDNKISSTKESDERSKLQNKSSVILSTKELEIEKSTDIEQKEENKTEKLESKDIEDLKKLEINKSSDKSTKESDERNKLQNKSSDNIILPKKESHERQKLQNKSSDNEILSTKESDVRQKLLNKSSDKEILQKEESDKRQFKNKSSEKEILKKDKKVKENKTSSKLESKKNDINKNIVIEAKKDEIAQKSLPLENVEKQTKTNGQKLDIKKSSDLPKLQIKKSNDDLISKSDKKVGQNLLIPEVKDKKLDIKESKGKIMQKEKKAKKEKKIDNAQITNLKTKKSDTLEIKKPAEFHAKSEDSQELKAKIENPKNVENEKNEKENVENKKVQVAVNEHLVPHFKKQPPKLIGREEKVEKSSSPKREKIVQNKQEEDIKMKVGENNIKDVPNVFCPELDDSTEIPQVENKNSIIFSDKLPDSKIENKGNENVKNVLDKERVKTSKFIMDVREKQLNGKTKNDMKVTFSKNEKNKPRSKIDHKVLALKAKRNNSLSLSKIKEKIKMSKKIEDEPRIIIKPIEKAEEIPKKEVNQFKIEEIKTEKVEFEKKEVQNKIEEKEFFDQKIDALVTILKNNKDERGLERVFNKIQTELKKNALPLFSENAILKEEKMEETRKSINPLGSWYEEKLEKEEPLKTKNEVFVVEPKKEKKVINISKKVNRKSEINISFVDSMKKFRPQKKDESKMKRSFAMMKSQQRRPENKKKVKKVLKLSLLGNKVKKGNKNVSKPVPKSKKPPKRPYTPYGMNRKEKYHEMKKNDIQHPKEVTVSRKVDNEKKIVNIGKPKVEKNDFKPEMKEEDLKAKLKEIRASIKAQNELKLIIKEKKSQPIKKGKKLQIKETQVKSTKKDKISENSKIDNKNDEIREKNEIKDEKILKKVLNDDFPKEVEKKFENKTDKEIKETKEVSTQCSLEEKKEIQKPPLKPKPVRIEAKQKGKGEILKIEQKPKRENVSPTRMLADPPKEAKKAAPPRIWNDEGRPSTIWGRIYSIVKQIITTDLREEEERRMRALVHSKPPRPSPG